ncbi:MAG: hypothetical protein IPP66_22790 [Anaerolineales bacterium]|nr:hypothetical protein [Anaerolineales bacterium]
MNLPSILGSIGTMIDLIRSTPQLARLIRARKAFGVSVDATGTSCVVSLGWLAYGIITDQPFVTLASGIIAASFFIITLIALRLGRSINEFRVTPAWLGVLLVSGIFFGKVGLGLALSISALISNFPQVRVAYKEEDLSGLSLGTWLLNLSAGLIWGGYALLQHDLTIIAASFFQTTTSTIIIALKIFKPSVNTSSLHEVTAE